MELQILCPAHFTLPDSSAQPQGLRGQLAFGQPFLHCSRYHDAMVSFALNKQLVTGDGWG